jgi:carbonic anhydrase/acetyltransferase-like protein (isoleucine patch superfamily)
MPIYALGDLEPTIHPDAYVHPDAVLIGDVRIGAGATVWPGAVLRADHGHIRIGERTSVQDGSVLHTTPQWPTDVAHDCVIGHQVHLEGCRIETRCLIGSGATILTLAVVGTGSVVGAQALVPERMQVPPDTLALGVPARFKPRPWGLDRVDAAVASYVENGRRFATDLRRID